MNRLITKSIEEKDTSYLRKFPPYLANEEERNIVKYILAYEKKHRTPPSIKAVAEKFEFFIWSDFHPSKLEIEEPPLSGVLEEAIERRKLAEAERISRNIEKAVRDKDLDEVSRLTERLTKLNGHHSPMDDDLDGFRIMTMEELKKPMPPRVFQFSVFEKGRVSALVGEGGTNKTNFATAAGLHVAAGQDFLGEPVSQAPVVYFNVEMDEDEYRRKVGQLTRGHDLPTDIPFYWVNLYELTLQDNDLAEFLASHVQRLGAGLVIFDSLMDIIGGKSDSDEEAVKLALKNIRKICQRSGATGLVLHHLNKQGGYRGTSVIRGETHMMMKFYGNSEGFVKAAGIKFRGIRFPKFGLDIGFSPDDTECTVTRSAVELKGDSETEVDYSEIVIGSLEFLCESTSDGWAKGSSLQEVVSEEIGISKRQVRNVLTALTDKKTLEVERRGMAKYYRLTEPIGSVLEVIGSGSD